MKLLSLLMIIFLLNLFASCYSTRIITSPAEIKAVLEKGADVSLEAEDLKDCRLRGENYIVVNDTLYGKGSIQQLYHVIPAKDVKIALTDIDRIGIKEYEPERSVVAGILVVAVTVGAIVFIVEMQDFIR